MPRATWVQTNFNGGEWSPLAYGRFDLAKYKNGLADCTNYMPTQQGGLTRRPGTRFIAATKDTTYPVRLQKYEFSTTQAYVLEFGNLYIRFYTNDGQLQTSGVAAYNAGTAYNIGDLVTNGGVTYYCIAATTGNAPPNATYWYAQTGTIYEIPTPYASTDIWSLSFVQKADVIYIALPTKPLYKLKRVGATNWQLQLVTLLDGPYAPLNVTGTTMTVTGTQGTVTVTASGILGINGGVGFRSQDVGRVMRIRMANGGPAYTPGTNAASSLITQPLFGAAPVNANPYWLWGTIQTVTDSTHITLALDASNNAPFPKQALAIANVTNGVVDGITVTDGGGGYYNQAANVVIAPHGNAAVVTGTVGLLGTVTGLTLVSGGSGYTASSTPSLQFVGTGNGAAGYATVNASGVVTGVTLTNGGFGYGNSVSVRVAGQGSGGGTGATATAVVNSDGFVTGITITNGGSGYTGGADVYISPPVPIAIAATRFWRMGLFNSIDGYPGVVSMHQDRLLLSGSTSYPNRIDASNTGDYENFAPSNIDSTIVDSNAYGFNLSSGPTNIIQWIASDENGMLVGTAGNEWLVTPSSLQQSITPTNINAKLMSNYGSSTLPPIRMGKATMFVQRTQRKLRELFFQFYGNTFLAQDISLVAEHLTASGIKQMTAQYAPQQIMWFALNNGSLTAATYDKDQEVNGWHKHFLGGFSDVAQTLPPLVDSVCAIPAPTAQRDELWLAVNRYINGATFRSIELVTKNWENGDTLPNAVQGLDSSAQYSGAPTTTVTGLTWLKGQTVGVLADGATHPDVVVDNTGAITLTRSASTVQVGLKYISKGKTLPIEAGGGDGPSQGKKKRIYRGIWRFFQSVGLSMSSDDPTVAGGYYPENFRTSANQMGQPVPLFNGIERWSSDTSWVEDGQIAFQQSDPLPSNITMLSAQLETEDGG